jgi:hypothetical protein
MLFLLQHYGLGKARHTLHGSQSSRMEHEPTQLLSVLWGPRSVADLSFRIVLLCQIEYDGTTLEDALAAI